MSVEDKPNQIFSYGIVLLLHIIKENAEKRLTKSGKLSINNSAKQINRINNLLIILFMICHVRIFNC